MTSVEVLNAAFHADSNAIRALIGNRVPCNRWLADDRFVVVGKSAQGTSSVSALGLINAVLAANGLPLVAAIMSDERDDNDQPQLLGFCEYAEQSR